MLLRGGLVAPVHLLFHERRPALAVDAEGRVVIAAAGFEEEHAGPFG